VRYAPPGLCLNDFNIMKSGDLYHLIHLQGPPIHPFDATKLETSYGHAVSKDLLVWRTEAPVFGISSHPSFDDSAIWTMHIVEHEDKLLMFYTGLSQDIYFRQQIGLAVSEKNDCTGWTRYGKGPLLSADPAYYQTEDEMAWRDPYVIFDQESQRWVMYVAAKMKGENRNKNGCIGLAISENLIDWKIQEPVLSPLMYSEMECPLVYRLNDDIYSFQYLMTVEFTFIALEVHLVPFPTLGHFLHQTTMHHA
jgi:sucrose-6-phosphate hydrolase SacC (GH32 family)